MTSGYAASGRYCRARKGTEKKIGKKIKSIPGTLIRSNSMQKTGSAL